MPFSVPPPLPASAPDTLASLLRPQHTNNLCLYLPASAQTSAVSQPALHLPPICQSGIPNIYFSICLLGHGILPPAFMTPTQKGPGGILESPGVPR